MNFGDVEKWAGLEEKQEEGALWEQISVAAREERKAGKRGGTGTGRQPWS